MLSKVKGARVEIATLRDALLAPFPNAIVECLPGLAAAVQDLGIVEQELRTRVNLTADPELTAEVTALKSDLRMVNALVERGATLFHGWAQLLGAATSGYRPSGEAAPLSASGIISVRG